MNLQPKINRGQKRLQLIWLICLLMGLSFDLSAQAWERLYSAWFNSGIDEGKAIVQTADGDLIAVGRTNSFSWGDMQFHLVKQTRDNELIWSQFLGTPGIDEPSDMILLPDGGLAIVGTSDWTGSGTTTADNNLYLMRTDADGQELWSRSYGDSINQEGLSLTVLPDGGYLLGGVYGLGGYLLRVDAMGEVIWEKTFTQTQGAIHALLPNGPSQFYAVLGNFGDYALLSFDIDGNEIWTKTGYGARLLRLPDGSFLNGAGVDNQLAKFDHSGNLLWSESYDLGSGYLQTMAVCPDGGIVLAGTHVLKTDVVGQRQWSLALPEGTFLTEVANDIITDETGSYLTGYDLNSGFIPEHMTVMKVTSNGRLFSNLLTGRVFRDTLENCSEDSGEPGLANWRVRVRKNADFWVMTDSTGHFSIPVDTGTYEVQAIPPGINWQSCTPIPRVTFSGANDTANVILPIQALVDCPELRVDISTPFLRRCFSNTYFVQYCNEGTITADSSYVEVTLDSFLIFENASIPYEAISPFVFRFQLGDLAVGECGQFHLTAELSCNADLGQTHCTEAHIFPDSICLTDTGWSGASVEVEGNCQGDSVQFLIRNGGNGVMTQPLNLIIIEDVVMYRQSRPPLAIGESTQVKLPANGATYILRADQEPGHPGNSRPTTAIEGCGTNGTGGSTTGIILQFPQDDGDSFIAIDCRQNRGSFDPNDKQGFPTGFGPEHFIEQGVGIDYLIRFQNTGTDTAFKVVIRDTLSPHVALSSLQLGAASHPYDFRIEENRILVFTFDPIALPDSNINEPASHGFIRFQLDQVPGLIDGTAITNRAAIYFDFNGPVITNTTLHTIGSDFVELIVATKNSLKSDEWELYPNPMTKEAVLKSASPDISPGYLKLYNPTGQLTQELYFQQSPIHLSRNQLPAGVYFYRIEDHSGALKGRGKVIIH